MATFDIGAPTAREGSAGPPPAERADAARNRALLLDAAAKLLQDTPADDLTMDAVAAAAGVGKGTVFRRFGSRSGLMHALLDRDETEFQRAVLSGPAPLGPGAPARERLTAYGRARLVTVHEHLDVVAAAEESRDFYTHPAYAFASMHVHMLLGQLGHRDGLAIAATAILAPLSARAVRHFTADRGMTLLEIGDEFAALVESLHPR